jgi:hypothetical protein
VAYTFSSGQFARYVLTHDIALESLAEDIGCRADLLMAFIDGLAAPTREFLTQLCDEIGVDESFFLEEG